MASSSREDIYWRPSTLFQGDDPSVAFDSVCICDSGHIIATRLDSPIVTKINPGSGSVAHDYFFDSAMNDFGPITCFTAITRVLEPQVLGEDQPEGEVFILAGGKTTYRQPRRGEWQLLEYHPQTGRFAVLHTLDVTYADYITALELISLEDDKWGLMIADGSPSGASLRIYEFGRVPGRARQCMTLFKILELCGVKSEVPSGPTPLFGINSLRMWDGFLYWTNQGVRAIYRVTVDPEGKINPTDAQPIEIAGAACCIGVHDVDRSRFCNFYYGITHKNTIGKISIGKEISDLYQHDKTVIGLYPFLGDEDSDAVLGPADCVSGRAMRRNLLFIVTNGGRFSQQAVGIGIPNQPGKVIAITIEEPEDVETPLTCRKRARGKFRAIAPKS